MRNGSYVVELTRVALDFLGGHADLAGRRKSGQVTGMPLVYPSAKFKLKRGSRLTLHSRLVESIQNDSIRP